MTKTATLKKTAVKFDKEEVSTLTFDTHDVLDSKNEIAKRKIDLQRAQALGAQSKSNIKIYFADAGGSKYVVEATVWAATERNVTLKGGILIPNRAIYKVGFF